MTPEQLKASILQRAMEGKLVPQDPSDEPASELLKRIKAEKEKLITEGKIKRDKKETEIFRGDDGKPYEKLADGTIQEIDVPYDIPESWEWVRLSGIIVKNIGGGTPSKSRSEYWNGEIPWASVKDLQGEFLVVTKDYITQSGLENSSSNVIPKGNIIIATRMGLNKICKNKIDVAINQDLRALTFSNDIMSDYFMKLYPIMVFESSGTTVKGISLDTFNQYVFPLPPLAEQKRIVEQIELALAKVDEYAESYNRLQELDKTFPDKLKKSILQYAMQGKLVEQDPNDEPVEVLLDKIRAEKQRLFAEGKLKKKDLEETIITQGDDNSYYGEVPKGWKLLQLKNLVQLHNGEKVVNKKLIYLDAKTLRGLKQAEYREKGNQVYTGDFVILVDGENSGELFNIPANGYMGSTFKKMYYLSIDSQIYINWFILSRKELLRNSKTGSAIPHLNKNLFKELVIGLPPISEQHRISNKISQVFSKINKLI
ncbi:restriction endonuclease subunit S [Streptococcus rifensis]